ncbi:hypothetical protein KC356_g8624 [Hortaea werneckii]|nr:hypothetical protein KC356_g8624 [Hortaea werneckii]
MRRRREEATAGCLEVLNQRHGSMDLQDIDSLVSAIVGNHTPGMDDLAAQELADYAQAYYKVALKRVIDEIAAHVTESVIFLQLPKLLDPSGILKMTQADIYSIAEESDARKLHRQLLQSKLDTLNRSSLLCELYVENRTAPPHQDLLQPSAELISSEDSTPLLVSDAPYTDNRRETIVASSKDASTDDCFEILDAAAPEAPTDEPSAAAPGEDSWGAPKKSKKKGKKMVSFTFLEEPTEASY